LKEVGDFHDSLDVARAPGLLNSVWPRPFRVVSGEVSVVAAFPFSINVSAALLSRESHKQLLMIWPRLDVLLYYTVRWAYI
jgi:hypothetical protein